MKTLPIAATLFAVLTLPLTAADENKKKPAAEKPAAEEPAAEGEKLSKEQSALKTALENHGRLKGFHVEVVLKTPEGNATLSGSLGEGSLSLDCKDVKGAKKKRVVAGGKFFLSGDDGKTWKTGEEAEKEPTLLFNNIITAPIQLQEQLVKGEFTAKEETMEGEEVLHLEKAARGEEAAVHIWLCREPEMKNMTFLRKVEMVVSGNDLELPATITYSKLTEPVKITEPEVK